MDKWSSKGMVFMEFKEGKRTLGADLDLEIRRGVECGI